MPLPGVDPPGRVGSIRPPLGGDEVEDLERRLFGGEVAAVTDGLAEPGVEALDGVGRVHDGAQLDREREERGELAPGPFPGVDHRRIPLPPLFGELVESGLGGVEGGGV